MPLIIFCRKQITSSIGWRNGNEVWGVERRKKISRLFIYPEGITNTFRTMARTNGKVIRIGNKFIK